MAVHDQAFKEALLGVTPLGEGRERVRRGSELPLQGGKARPPAARPPPIDPTLVRKLRHGQYPVEGSVDLHGLSAKEARLRTERTLTSARALGKRCMLVIHGRGLHSEDEPVLGLALPGWLSEPPLRDIVLAAARARPEHGGSGATYVLLRKP